MAAIGKSLLIGPSKAQFVLYVIYENVKLYDMYFFGLDKEYLSELLSLTILSVMITSKSTSLKYTFIRTQQCHTI